MRERDWQRTVIDAFHARGYRVYHTHDSRHSAKGFPDIVAIREQRLVFLELKTERGKVSPEQQEWLDAIELASGGPVICWGVVRPSDWPDVEAFLEEP